MFFYGHPPALPPGPATLAGLANTKPQYVFAGTHGGYFAKLYAPRVVWGMGVT